MKKMIVMVVFVMGLVVGNVFAAGEEIVSPEAKETFAKEFPDAEFPQWETIANSEIYTVRFVYDNQGFVAYISEKGTMIASARMIKNENLPYKVSQIIRKKYSAQEILKIEELTMDGILSYFFTIENDNARVLLQVYYDGTVQKISEEKKKISIKQ